MNKNFYVPREALKEYRNTKITEMQTKDYLPNKNFAKNLTYTQIYQIYVRYIILILSNCFLRR
jgi:hypothetical protein